MVCQVDLEEFIKTMPCGLIFLRPKKYPLRRKKAKMLEACANEYKRRGSPVAAVLWTVEQALAHS